jgi:tetratricopeptide (TPR) repeat protein
LLLSKIKPRQLTTEHLKQYHYILARLYIDLHDSEAALAELELARELAEKTTDYEALARVRHLIGGVYMFQNKPVQAIEQLRNALQPIEAGLVKDFQFQLGVYSNLGILNYQLGDKEEAISMYREALKIAENVLSQEKSAGMYWSLSQAYRDAGNLGNSKTFALKSLALYEWIGVSRALTQLRAGFGVIMLESKRFEEAEVQFSEALKLATLQNDLERLTYANLNLAELYLEQGQLQKARQFSDAMINHLDSVDHTTRGQAYSSRASLLAALQDNDGAVQHFDQAVELLKSNQAKELLSKVYFRFAGVLKTMGNTMRATEMYELAFRYLNQNGSSPEI